MYAHHVFRVRLGACYMYGVSFLIINLLNISKIMLPREKTEQLSDKFDRTGTCQTCEENDTFEDYGMCPQMVYDSVEFHINEVLKLLNSLESKADIEKAKKFYSDCLNDIPY